MHRLVGEESIFNNPMEMVESVLSICKSYEVYNISAKLISRSYTGWHQYPVVKIENGCLYMNSVTGDLKSLLWSSIFVTL